MDDEKVLNYFISAFRNGKNVFMDQVRDEAKLRQILRDYSDCEIEVYDMDWVAPVTDGEPPVQKPFVPNNRVRFISCNETGERFKSIREASRSTGIPYKSINASLHRPVKAYGLTFTYVYEDENE